MKVNHFFSRVVLVAITITVLAVLFDFISVGISEYTDYLWVFLANLLISGVFGFYVVQSYYHSYKLWLATFIIYYVIGSFNILIEALIFNVIDQSLTINAILIGVPSSAFKSFIMILSFNRWRAKGNSIPNFLPRKLHHWIGRILVGNFLYFFFYFSAGILLQAFTPRFAEFYGDKIPPLVDIVITNMFFRGFVFVGIAILIDRTVLGSKFTKAVLIGIIFSIVGGIAPLIPPNEFMPVFIRVAHGFEVGISNFLYGIFVYHIVSSKLPKQIVLKSTSN